LRTEDDWVCWLTISLEDATATGKQVFHVNVPEPILRRVLEKNPRYFYGLPSGLRSREICALAADRFLQNDNRAFHPGFNPAWVAKCFPCGRDMLFLGPLIKKHPILLECLTNYYQTEQQLKPYQQIVEDAYPRTWHGLSFLPMEMRTKERCFVAVNTSGRSLRYVPMQFVDRALCLLAVERDFRSLESVPANYIDEKLCELALAQDITAIEYIPPSFQTPALHLIAAKKYPLALKHIPFQYQTRELIRAALERDPHNYTWISSSQLVKDMCPLVFDALPCLLRRLPGECRTYVSLQWNAVLLTAFDLAG
jgi:hypothetical protein